MCFYHYHRNHWIVCLIASTTSILLGSGPVMAQEQEEILVPLVVPACTSTGPFQCSSNGRQVTFLVDSDDACSDACRICEGADYFCPDFKVTEVEIEITVQEDDDIIVEGHDDAEQDDEQNVDGIVLNNSQPGGQLAFGRTSHQNDTNATTFFTNSSSSVPPNATETILMVERHYECRCFPVFTDTTACEETSVRADLCRDPKFDGLKARDASAATPWHLKMGVMTGMVIMYSLVVPVL